MSLYIKICGLRDEESVSAAVESGANALGFVFAESPRQLSPTRAAELAMRLPDHVQTVAVTRHPDGTELAAVFAAFSPDYLQTDAADFSAISLPENCRALPVFREHSNAQEKVRTGTRFLFEGGDSGTGRTADWNEARNLAGCGELILAGGLTIDNVAAAIEHVRPWGVDVSSGVEYKRGIKNPELIRKFITRVREQENSVE